MRIRWSKEPAYHQAVADYVLAHFPELVRFGRLRPHGAVAVVGPNTETGEDSVIGGIVLSNYNGFDAQLSIYFERPVSFTKGDLKALFSYCFDNMKLTRLTCRVATPNTRSARFVERLGFKREGCLRFAYDGKQHASIYGMVRKDCKWLKEG